MIIFIVILCLLFPGALYATGEFTTIQSTKYNIQQDGSAQVKDLITIKNNYSEIYPKKYSINIIGSKISNISTTNKANNIVENVHTTESSSKIDLVFTNPSLGKDAENIVEINYEIKEAAAKKGNTWEISIPKNTSIYHSIEISVPASFGKVSFTSVKNLNTNYFADETLINIPSNNTDNIYLIFGDYQLFDFNLKYYIENTNDYTVSTEIPLPPETNSQNVFISDINPKPNNIEVDPDGNWLAQYYLKANEKIIISTSGQIKVSPPSEKIKERALDNHLSEDTYWPTQNSQIIEISKNLKSPRKIYDYVVKTLSYDFDNYEKSSRKGAEKALSYPNLSVCTEFTDLFIALSRAAKVPSREIEGYAYTNNPNTKPVNLNTDILHAWPQYYDSDQEKWISVDPTWEKTTNGIDYFNDLDLNHIVFVIHGINSQYPPPPGSYKDDSETKTVFIEYATNEIIHPELIPPEIELRTIGIFGDEEMIIRNSNHEALVDLSLYSTQLGLSLEQVLIPPFSYINIKTEKQNLAKSVINGNKEIEIIAKYNTLEPITIKTKNKSYYSIIIFLSALTITLLCLGGIIITKRKNV